MKALLALVIAFVLSGVVHAQNPQVQIRTSRGVIVAELYADKAPRTVDNFLRYARDGHYNGTIFHRVIDGFMIQGGGFDRDMRQKPTRDPIQNEAGNRLKNLNGTLAMARTPNPHSATAQFFINVKDNDFLDFREPTAQGFGYAVFGKVIQGMDVVTAITKVPTGNSGQHQNVPREPVVIESVSLVEKK